MKPGVLNDDPPFLSRAPRAGLAARAASSRRRGLPVRATVRREDERAEALSTPSAYRFVHCSHDIDPACHKAAPPFVPDAGRGCLHRVSKNPGKMKTRLIAVVPNSRNAKAAATPASKRE